MNLRVFLLMACALVTGACGAPTVQPETAATTPAASDRTPAGVAAQRLQIDPAQSWLRVRVYRSGRLARFGHNHVVSSNGLGGYVELGAQTADTVVAIDLPLASLVVDDPDARDAEGDDFTAGVPQKDRDATRQNMLGDALLNAAAFPDITLRSVRVEGQLPDVVVVTQITVAGQTQTVELPVHVEQGHGRMIASGDVIVTHEALGLTPFSALLGALRVRDDIGLNFYLVALATDTTEDNLL